MYNLYCGSNIININSADGLYDSLDMNSEKIFNSNFTKTTTGQISISSGAIQFDGTFGLKSNNLNIINFKEDTNTYIEFDILITDSTSSRSDGIQYVFDLTNSITAKKIESFGISVLQKFAQFIGYNNTDQAYTIHHIYYDFNVDTSYNFKIIKYNNSIFIYVNNILKYKSRMFNESSGIGTLGPRNESYNNGILKLGQFDSTASEGSNLKGSLSNFKVLSFYDKDFVINNGLETNSEYLIHHIPFDYIQFSPTNSSSYIPIIDIGKTDNVSLSRPILSNTTHFYNIGQLYWWYKPSTHVVALNTNIIKNNDIFSIIFKMFTESTLLAGTIIDTRSSGTAFNNMVLLISSADTSTFTLRFSNAETTNNWSFEYTFPTGILSPSTEYIIGFIRQNNNIKLFINYVEIGSVDINFPAVNWTNTTTTFFNSVDANDPIPHYVRDLRIYNTFVDEPPVLDQSKIFNIVYDHNNQSAAIDQNLEYYINPKRSLQLKYDRVLIDSNRETTYVYMHNDIFNSSYNFTLFAEGHKNKKIYVYLNNVLLYEAIDTITLNITNNISRYKYRVEGSDLIKSFPTKSMIKGHLFISVTTNKCEGSDFYIRLYKTNSGEFIGDYELVNNNNALIENLIYGEYYDAILIDKNKIFENIVKSKLKTILSDTIILRESIVIIRELSYYEAITRYTKELVDSKLLLNPGMSYISINVTNTSKDVTSSKINLFNGTVYNEISEISIKPAIRVKKLIGYMDTSIYVTGNILNRIDTGSLIEIDNELLYVNSVDLNLGIIDVNRGVIDTIPNIHITDTIINILSENTYIDKETNIGVNIKAISSNSLLSNTLNSTKVDTNILTNRIQKPLPPVNVRINDEYYPNEISDILIINWNNRLIDSQLDNCFSVTDIDNTNCIINIFDDNDTLLLSSLNSITNEYIIPADFDTITQYFKVEIYITNNIYNSAVYKYRFKNNNYLFEPINIVQTRSDDDLIINLSWLPIEQPLNATPIIISINIQVKTDTGATYLTWEHF